MKLFPLHAPPILERPHGWVEYMLIENDIDPDDTQGIKVQLAWMLEQYKKQEKAIKK